MGLRLTIAENLGRNWDLAATVQGRTGRDLYADGVFSNSLNAAILLSKRFGDRHLFSLLTVVPVSMRSLRTSSTREAFDLTEIPSTTLRGAIRTEKCAAGASDAKRFLWPQPHTGSA